MWRGVPRGAAVNNAPARRLPQRRRRRQILVHVLTGATNLHVVGRIAIVGGRGGLRGQRHLGAKEGRGPLSGAVGVLDRQPTKGSTRGR
jgi:hypothetical protein